MGKIAFIFPGQGSQYIGMAQTFYDHYEESKKVFAQATEAAGFSIEDLCFQENEKLHQTRYTQPALLTAICAILKAVEKEGIVPDITAGLSLGEYGALVASGAMDFQTAVQVVCKRGIYMEEAVPGDIGCMAAVISRKPLPLEQICEETEGLVQVANYNCPGQRVITGEKKAVEEAGKKLLEAGAFRVVPLKVSGPFHSSMLTEAGAKLRDLLETVPVQEPEIPFISNVTAEQITGINQMKDLLGKQVCSSVRWEQSVRNMIEMGADTFVEIGPGKTLSGFMKKIDPSVKVFHVETVEDLETIAELRRTTC
jgi:[acyl-carrier-protein] S-malonyltransferase